MNTDEDTPNENKGIAVNGKPNTSIFALVSVTVGLAAYVWDLSFNFGAFGVIFIRHIIAIWIFSISILLIAIVVEREILPGNKWWGGFMLGLPSVWLITRIVDESAKAGQLTDHLLQVASILSMVISLPYLIYLFFYFTNPNMIRLERKALAGLAAIVVLIAIVGYTLGSHNYLIMSCENFIVSGQDTPKNCTEKEAESVTNL